MDITILASILGVGGLGLLFGAGLAFASKKFAVYVDPKIEEIISALPGANCGGCGYPGCSGYAEAVVKSGAPMTLCSPGGDAVVQKIAAIMGVEAVEAGEKKVAVVQCQGSHENAPKRYHYAGITNCHAAQILMGGDKACVYGCLGYGTCVESCPFGAMRMGDDGLPIVIEEKCTGCGMCVAACPRGIMKLIPVSQKIFLGCVSQDKGKAVKQVCKVGCTACTLCANPKVTPSGSIQMKGNLPEIINIKADDLANAVEKCPSHCFVVRGKAQLAEVSAEIEQTV
ncbi:MAG: RnfABCDGE type electron transport complex subunit B [candidate division KSB1 bacterium]|nr:RnfABCDGE type electron transport complex subunit B [candidate division KSB1 bacterium]MDZ7334334.1 RnfABCDGE type electron transport complex subunit B [candidate division KSB1 bacterium]MDZ7356375.1 RnfABCDGE type electron transport complex subunit B [candidate division KSB1 bacterium]MDZ7375309.1 RnfABCDGE type electron transport complex subunit B [candidate division KSB1 bacterium]MDZ7399317.1 RnfABCDGE type electron transport complex subunit B [candidate division KSB1 bacterium]